MADQQEIPIVGPLGLAPGDRVERAPTGLAVSSYTITPPSETGIVMDVMTGAAGVVQTVWICSDIDRRIIEYNHIATPREGSSPAAWRKVVN